MSKILVIDFITYSILNTTLFIWHHFNPNSGLWEKLLIVVLYFITFLSIHYLAKKCVGEKSD